MTRRHYCGILLIENKDRDEEAAKMTNSFHIDNCFCTLKHFDAITAEGKRNLVTYEIDYDCYMKGVRAGEGTGWTIVSHKK